MKKYIIPTLAALVLLASSTAFAQQTEDDHDLRVTIPEVVMIRILAPTGEAAFVEFDYAATANQPTYFAALELGGNQTLPPTDGNISDIEVLAIGTTWQINVSAPAFALGGVSLADIGVTPDPAFGTPFTLSTGTAALGGGATPWTSLGIDWESYSLTVNGDEDAGDETIIVTYTIVDL